MPFLFPFENTVYLERKENHKCISILIQMCGYFALYKSILYEFENSFRYFIPYIASFYYF